MKKILIGILGFISISACGLSPQVVIIDPVLKSTEATSNKNVFQLNVSDERESNILGTRGGVYNETSIIKTEGDITPLIKSHLTEAFKKSGYIIDATAMTHLDVSVIKLSYKASGENRIGEVEVTTEIIASINTKTEKFSKTYKVNRKQEVLKAPSEKKNNEMINQILSAVLQRVLEDEELLNNL